jgi:hypothetical protein
LTYVLAPILGTALGSLASSFFGGGGSTANPSAGAGSASAIGVSNTAPLVFGAAKQAGQEASTNVANRYGSLGLGDSTMASIDETQAKTQPFIGAATNIANLDLSAQKFNATAAQNYQNQMQQFQNELGSFLGGNAGQAAGGGLGAGNPFSLGG